MVGVTSTGTPAGVTGGGAGDTRDGTTGATSRSPKSVGNPPTARSSSATIFIRRDTCASVAANAAPGAGAAETTGTPSNGASVAVTTSRDAAATDDDEGAEGSGVAIIHQNPN